MVEMNLMAHNQYLEQSEGTSFTFLKSRAKNRVVNNFSKKVELNI